MSKTQRRQSHADGSWAGWTSGPRVLHPGLHPVRGFGNATERDLLWNKFSFTFLPTLAQKEPDMRGWGGDRVSRGDGWGSGFRVDECGLKINKSGAGLTRSSSQVKPQAGWWCLFVIRPKKK